MRIKNSVWIICLSLFLGLAGCGKQGSPSKEPADTSSLVKDVVSKNRKQQKAIAISMPSQSNERWISAAAAMDTSLTEAGFQTLVEFAEDNAQQQISQLEGFLEQGVGCLIVTPVPSADLSEVLGKARKTGIPVISYERLSVGTESVDYYAGFDNLEAGRQIGEYIVREKGLDKDKASACTIEFFSGDPLDYSAKIVHQGILETLQPYLDSGRLVCKSGRVKFEDTAILYESEDTAQKNCEALLDANYLDGHLDIACTSSDILAGGVRKGLENREYAKGEGWPLITGQDTQLAAVKNMIDGYQSMSVFRDTRILAEKCAEMAIDCLNGKKPASNDQKQYKNSKNAIPAYLCGTEAVDKENYKKVLINSGYYTKSQLP